MTTDDVMVSTRSVIERQIMTSRCLSRSVRTRISEALCSTRKKSRCSPACTVFRATPENPPIRLTPNNEEIASLIRKASRMASPGSAVVMFHASSMVISTGS
ncbi:hypothetical protein EMIT0357P_20326 [Pseudomonas marginalis]